MAFLFGVRATKIEVTNNLSESGTINIDIVNDYHVHFAEDGEHCRAILTAGFHAQGNPDMLTVLCTLVGDFTTIKNPSDEDKKRIHIDCYHMIFPYAQSLVSRLCTDAGLPPFFLQEMEIHIEDVTIKD